MSSLKGGGKPYVLAEDHARLRAAIANQLHDPAAFWKKLDDLPTAKEPIPAGATRALEQLLPEHIYPIE